VSLKKSVLKTSDWALDDKKEEHTSCKQIRQAWERVFRVAFALA